MRIVAQYDFKNGLEVITTKYANEYADIVSAINSVSAENCKNKISREKTMPGTILYCPSCLNKAFATPFHDLGWHNRSVKCNYQHGEYLHGYVAVPPSGTMPFRDMDFVKTGGRVGVEVQFGKYAFMAYNVCAKMTIFHNLDIIDAGVEIVPVKNFAREMSSGVSYFEQIAWDLHTRGEADIDIPVLILGVDV